MFYETEKELPELVKQYLLYITTIKNRSIKTAKAYEVDLINFFRFYKFNKQLVKKDRFF